MNNPSIPQFWLMKSEPSVFGIDDLAACPEQTTHWDGVRNFQARNMMRDQMQPRNLAFFYHSNCKEPGIVGVMEIVREGYPDFTAFEPDSPYFDPKSTPDNPRWFMVDVKLIGKFDRTITLNELKSYPELDGFKLLQRGNRLSVMPVDAQHWAFISKLSKLFPSQK